jgi:hypothetical protein
MRAQVRLERGQLCLRSRPGRDCTVAFPELAELSAGLRKRRVRKALPEGSTAVLLLPGQLRDRVEEHDLRGFWRRVHPSSHGR